MSSQDMLYFSRAQLPVTYLIDEGACRNGKRRIVTFILMFKFENEDVALACNWKQFQNDVVASCFIL